QPCICHSKRIIQFPHSAVHSRHGNNGNMLKTTSINESETADIQILNILAYTHFFLPSLINAYISFLCIKGILE
ncbi:hypothetical protein D7X25_25955, partial [bacterium 1XD42-8]